MSGVPASLNTGGVVTGATLDSGRPFYLFTYFSAATFAKEQIVPWYWSSCPRSQNVPGMDLGKCFFPTTHAHVHHPENDGVLADARASWLQVGRTSFVGAVLVRISPPRPQKPCEEGLLLGTCDLEPCYDRGVPVISFDHIVNTPSWTC